MKQLLSTVPDTITQYKDEFVEIENNRKHFLENWNSIQDQSDSEFKKLESQIIKNNRVFLTPLKSAKLFVKEVRNA